MSKELLTLFKSDGEFLASLGDADSLELYLDAEDTNTVATSGSNVTGWTDKSARGRTVTVNGSPTYDSDEWNRGINFDGTNDYLTVDAASDWAFLSNGEGATMLVGFESAEKEPDRYNVLLCTNTTGNTVGIRMGQDDRSGFSFDERMSFYVNNGSANIIAYNPSDNQIDTGKKQIYGVRYGEDVSENDFKINIDREAVVGADDTGAPSASDPAVTLQICQQGNNSGRAYGKLSFVVIWSSKLSDEDMDAAIDWLATRTTKTRKTVILIGQSNAEGQGVNTDMISGLQGAQANRFIWNNSNTAWEQLNIGSNNLGNTSSNHGIEPHLMKKLQEDYGEDVFLFKYAVGGTSLHTDWAPDGPGTQWSTMETQWNNARSELTELFLRPDVVGVIWYQGEDDADNTTNAEAYEDNLTNFKTAIRNIFGASVPFIEPKIYVPDDTYSEWETVNIAKQAVAALDSNHTYINEDIATIDDVHITSVGLGRIGFACAEAITGVSWVRLPDLFSPHTFIDFGDQDTLLDSSSNVVDASSNEAIDSVTNKGSASISIVTDSTKEPVYNTGRAQINFGTYFEVGGVSDYTEFHEIEDITAILISDIVTEATSTLFSTNDGAFAQGISISYFDDGPANTYRFDGGTGAAFIESQNGSADDYDVATNAKEVTTVRVDPDATNDYNIYGKDGSASISFNALNVGSGDASQVLHLGIRGTENTGFAGFFHGFFVWKRTFSDSELNQIWNAIEDYYGVTVTNL